jgi:uncharacterized RDD family membrane protein YckC
VLAFGEHRCKFCDSTEVIPLPEERASSRSQGNLALSPRTHEQWRGELNQRLQAYRARRRKSSPSDAQTALPFDDHVRSPFDNIATEVEDHLVDDYVGRDHVENVETLENVENVEHDHPPAADDFAFTIAIGRVAQRPELSDPRLLIDVSVPPQSETPVLEPLQEPATEQLQPPPNGLYPAASLDDRRHALLIDIACLAFAYGGFLALFGSLGGHFTLSKLSATVCFFTFAFVYLQYFGLFTVFGGSTPGMMVSGIQVASFTGDTPTPRQHMLRAVGYLLSAGTCFLGFLWVLWDEDGLTWHDRLSNTYLARVESFVDEDISHPAAARY